MRENDNKESKVSKALRRFEENDTITHRVDGHADMNEAVEPRGRSAVRAVRRIVDWVCNGSVEEVLVGMVDTDMINRKQLRMLADRIGRRKPGRK